MMRCDVANAIYELLERVQTKMRNHSYFYSRNDIWHDAANIRVANFHYSSALYKHSQQNFS